MLKNAVFWNLTQFHYVFYVCFALCTKPKVACVEHVAYLLTMLIRFHYCIGRNGVATAQTLRRHGFGKVVQGDCISRVAKIHDILTPICHYMHVRGFTFTVQA
jgi:hypothetical protein